MALDFRCFGAYERAQSRGVYLFSSRPRTNTIFGLAAGLQAVGRADPRFLFSTTNPVSQPSRRALPTLAHQRRLTRR